MWTLLYFLRYIMGFSFLGPFPLSGTWHLFWPMRWEGRFPNESSEGKASYPNFNIFLHILKTRIFILLQEARVLFIFQDCVVMLSLPTLLDYWHFCNSLHHYEETDVNGETLSWADICPLMFSGIISSCFPNLLPVWYFRVMTLLEWSKDNDSKNLGGII